MTQDSGRSITAVILILMGIAFLATQFIGGIDIGLFWPFFIVLPGVAFLVAAFTGDKRVVGLIFPGLIITGTGLILLVQNWLDLWHTWAYVWTVYPGLVGLGLLFSGYRFRNEEQVRTGRTMFTISLLAFVGFAIFFELIVFGGFGFGAWNIILPVLLIAAGAYLLVAGRRSNRKRKITE